MIDQRSAPLCNDIVKLQWTLVSKRHKLSRTHRTFTLLVSAVASSSAFQSWPWWSFKSVQCWRMRQTERRERKKYSLLIRFCSASLRRQRSERVAFSYSWVGGEWQWIKEPCVCVCVSVCMELLSIATHTRRRQQSVPRRKRLGVGRPSGELAGASVW